MLVPIWLDAGTPSGGPSEPALRERCLAGETRLAGVSARPQPSCHKKRVADADKTLVIIPATTKIPKGGGLAARARDVLTMQTRPLVVAAIDYGNETDLKSLKGKVG